MKTTAAAVLIGVLLIGCTSNKINTATTVLPAGAKFTQTTVVEYVPPVEPEVVIKEVVVEKEVEKIVYRDRPCPEPTTPVVVDPVPPIIPIVTEPEYSTNYHHIFPLGDGIGYYTDRFTLVQCPGEAAFDKCYSDGVAIRNMGLDDGRFLWASPINGKLEGPIVCYRGETVIQFAMPDDDKRGVCP